MTIILFGLTLIFRQHCSAKDRKHDYYFIYGLLLIFLTTFSTVARSNLTEREIVDIKRNFC